jgi:hypothetical protein
MVLLVCWIVFVERWKVLRSVQEIVLEIPRTLEVQAVLQAEVEAEVEVDSIRGASRVLHGGLGLALHKLVREAVLVLLTHALRRFALHRLAPSPSAAIRLASRPRVISMTRFSIR